MVATKGLRSTSATLAIEGMKVFTVSFDTGRDIFFSVRPGADWTSLNRIGRPFQTARFIDSSGSSSGLRLWGGSMIFIDG